MLIAKIPPMPMSFPSGCSTIGGWGAVLRNVPVSGIPAPEGSRERPLHVCSPGLMGVSSWADSAIMACPPEILRESQHTTSANANCLSTGCPKGMRSMSHVFRVFLLPLQGSVYSELWASVLLLSSKASPGIWRKNRTGRRRTERTPSIEMRAMSSSGNPTTELTNWRH